MSLTGALVRVVLAASTGPPLQPDRDEARRWAATELASAPYRSARPSLLRRAISWLLEQLSTARSATPSGVLPRLLLAALVLALMVAAAMIVARIGAPRRTARGRGEHDVFGGAGRTADAHRASADAAAAAGDHRTAVVERFRAVARDLEQRAVLTVKPGRTAGEVALDAARWLPDLFGALQDGARIFDEARYGHRTASAADDARMRAIDDAVRTTRPSSVPMPSGHDLVAPG